MTHESILAQLGTSDDITTHKPIVTYEELVLLCDTEDLSEMLEMMKNDCIRYAETVCKFLIQLSHGEDAKIGGEYEAADNSRKHCHDATMMTINALVRLLTKSGKKADWMKEFRGDRTRYGRFALLIAFEVLKSERKEVVV